METIGVGAGSPSRIAAASVATSSGENPARAATIGSSRKVTAGPLIALSIPFSTSTTPLTLLMLSATLGAHCSSSAASGEYSLIWMGSGALVKSPIMSCNVCMNSTSRAGSCFLISPRTSSMTSSIPRLRLLLSFTETSPVFASVTEASPNCIPVRRDVLSTSGVSCNISSTWLMTRLVSARELPAGMM